MNERTATFNFHDTVIFNSGDPNEHELQVIKSWFDEQGNEMVTVFDRTLSRGHDIFTLAANSLILVAD